MDTLTLKARILLPLILVGMIVFAVGNYFVINLEARQKNNAVMQQAEAMQAHLKSVLAAKAEVMEASLRFIAQDKQLIAALQAQDRNALLALSTPIYQQLHERNNVTHFYFHDAQRVNLLRVHAPQRQGDIINRYTALAAQQSGTATSGIELGPLGTFTLRSVLPVFNDGQLIGYIELGQEIDGLIRDARTMFHVELYMLIEKQFLRQDEWEAGMRMLNRSFNWNTLTDAVLVSQSLPETPVALLDGIARAHNDTLIGLQQDIELQGHRYWASIIPVRDAGGRQVGLLVMLRDMTQLVSQSKKDSLLFTGLSATLCLLILILFYVILGRTEQALNRARQALIAASKAREAQVERELNIQRVLDSILNISLPPLTLKEVLSKSLDAVLSIPAFALLNKGAIFLTISNEQMLEMVAQRNLPEPLLHSCAVLPFGKCLCGKAAATREMVFFNKINDQHEISYDGIEAHGHYCIPIMSGGKLLGVLNAYVAAGHPSDESEKAYLKTVADTLAIVIERKQDEEKLELLAHNDLLTGLPNRALFHDRLEQSLAMAKRNQHGMSVLFLDLDHFKEINDTLGHDMGDVLLRETALRLQSCVRKMDTVARMGGDEFTVILTGTNNSESAEIVAKKILQVLLMPFELKGQLRTVGCSIGISRYPEHGTDSETLIKHADAAMYYAKRKRNTYCSFSDAR